MFPIVLLKLPDVFVLKSLCVLKLHPEMLIFRKQML